MNRLKQIIASFTLAFIMTLSITGLVNASSNWKVDISTPLTQATKTFNVQYTTLSTEATDSIKVDLYQNGTMVGTQTTVKPFGDSGVFAVTVPSTGTYEYYIVAANGADTQTTETKTVNVVEPKTQVNTTFVNNGQNGDNATGGLNTAGSNPVNNQANSGNSGNSNQSNNNGKVDAAGDSSKDNQPGTLGESKKSDSKKNDNKTAWIIIAGAVVAVVLYANRSKLMRKKSN